ncbi:hypothetical protein [Flavobacterium humi]|uniref:Uncharacterized protein n=1 Tax=Flavobacterium humi TaxID=2562683 RepID=A0A4Z0L9N8_9FLAO|nr:hypothetical protein [Flavobacterium humi]TGD58739.1 hypothetical protein E4635_07435 [Flavobacterium humi]
MKKKKIIPAIIVVVFFGFIGNAQYNNTALALRRTIMVINVELLQRTMPTKTTKEDFNKELIEMSVSKEGIIFLNKAFDFYKKEVSTEEILNSYEGKEIHEVVRLLKNGGRNVFGDIDNMSLPDKKEHTLWLKSMLKVLAEVMNIVINTCNALPWPC